MESEAKRFRSSEPHPPASSDDFECRRYQTPDGCPFGDRCRYRHGPEDSRDLFPDSKAKPCTKFFSTSGCPYGEECHFQHYIPGGISALGITPRSSMPPGMPGPGGPWPPAGSPMGRGPGSGRLGGGHEGDASKICRRFTAPGGCRFGDRCHFSHVDPDAMARSRPPGGRDFLPGDGYGSDRFGGGQWEGPGGFKGGSGLPMEPVSPGRGGGGPMGPASDFGSTTSAKIPIDASLVGAIIGKAGSVIKQIQRQSGARVAVRDHESDTNLRNVEMEGSLEQIEYATRMVRQHLAERASQGPPRGGGDGFGSGPPHGGGGGRGPSSLGPHNYKTRMCEKFENGTCTFGSRCHFAHNPDEIRSAPPRD
ncbi:hypothetical protein CLOM_g5008 [Closterium sp. NIES-68]|nr:hypothetical protein CLOM_g5008 [Closterium sp. NIES-68]GJP67813.1 hypothetical protein CLOP_g24583 [Closterium sp. NIES-67]